jgi:GDPmannose 4,6-dehydratase
MPRALITGITGQDGLYLAELLCAEGMTSLDCCGGSATPSRDLWNERCQQFSLYMQ